MSAMNEFCYYCNETLVSGENTQRYYRGRTYCEFCYKANGYQDEEVSIQLREEQILATTEEERDKGNDNNPILYAESGPNRFRVMSWFFPEEDGVNVEEDIDAGLITIKYFKGNTETELEEGSVLYEWALDLFNND